jgi:hypothetical protein
MNLAAMERATWKNPNAVHMAERFAVALLRHAVEDDRGWLYLPIEEMPVALFPKLFADPPQSRPTGAKPRTAEKLFAQADRWIEGLSLWNPQDT